MHERNIYFLIVNAEIETTLAQSGVYHVPSSNLGFGYAAIRKAGHAVTSGNHFLLGQRDFSY